MKRVVGAIPILAVLVLVFVGLVGTQLTSAAVGIGVQKPNPVPGDDEGVIVDTDDANFNTVLTITVTGATAYSGGTLPSVSVIDTVDVELDADESGDALYLELLETTVSSGIFQGRVKIVDEASSSTTVSSTSSRVDADAASIDPSTVRLAVEDDDEITIKHTTVVERIDVENEAPDLGSLAPAHGSVVDDTNVDLEINITDDDSGIPTPEDLADGDSDSSYTSIVFFKSSVQCTDAELITELETVGPTAANIDTVDCDGSNNVITRIQITDEDDLDEIDDGYAADLTVALGEGDNYIGLIAFDKAGNYVIFDADDTETTETLALVTVDDDAPSMFTGGVRTGVGWDDIDKVYEAGERDMIQVILEDATDLASGTIDVADFSVPGHVVSRVSWYDVDPEEIEGGPDAGTPNTDGPLDADGTRKFTCSLGGAVVACTTADASILRPASWTPQSDSSTLAPDNNRFAMIRNSVFIELESDLDPDAEPDVYIVPNGIDDEAGNNLDSDDKSASDLIGPGFAVVSLESPNAGKLDLAGDDDDVEMIITSDEDLTSKPTVTVSRVIAPDGCVTAGVIAISAAAPCNASAAYASGPTSRVIEIGTNRWRVEIDDPSATGFINVYIQGTDENGNADTEGIAPADIAADFFDSDGAVDGDAHAYQADVALPDPYVEVAGDDGSTDPEVEFRNPFFIKINFKKNNTGGSSNENAEYESDGYDDVTLTQLDLNGTSILDDAKTTDNQVFTVAISGIAIGDHELEIQAEDEAGNLLDEVVEVDFEVAERASFDIAVNPGWSLMSIPGAAADSSVAGVFGSDGNVTTVYSYDAHAAGGWLVAVYADGEWTGTLETVSSTSGYWMLGDTVGELEIDIPRLAGGADAGATPIQPPTIGLTNGWNLVPVSDVTGEATYDPGEVGGTIDADLYFASVNENIQRILGYNTITNEWEITPFAEDAQDSDDSGTTLDDPDLDYGAAYWVYITGGPVTLVP